MLEAAEMAELSVNSVIALRLHLLPQTFHLAQNDFSLFEWKFLKELKPSNHMPFDVITRFSELMVWHHLFEDSSIRIVYKIESIAARSFEI